MALQPMSLMSRSSLGRMMRERPFDAVLTGGRQRKEIVAAEAHGLGAQRERLEHMGAALHAAVHHHVDPVADGIHHFGQLVERRCASRRAAGRRDWTG